MLHRRTQGRHTRIWRFSAGCGAGRITSALVALLVSMPAGSQASDQDVAKLADRVETQQELIEALRGEVVQLRQYVDAIRSDPVQRDNSEPTFADRDRENTPVIENLALDRSIAGHRESDLRFFGDARLRYEANIGPQALPDRHRGVLRARLAARYDLSDRLTLGTRLTTGDRDNPNSTDVTLSDFNDGFEVSLDQAFARYLLGPADVYAGQFPQILRRTDLVWDGDVNPQGAGVSVAWEGPAATAWAGRGLLMIIDEDAVGSDSTMAGIQGEVALPIGAWTATLAAAYYDYDLGSVAGADIGDFRSNRRNASGNYLSDFDLVNLSAEFRHHGITRGWPVSVVIDYVNNTGAVDDQDTGWGTDVYLGETEPGRWRLRYGYAEAETDAVFAAFSQDNIEIATNYRLHTAAVDYTVDDRVGLNLTWYRYRPLRLALFDDPHGWRNRIRLNASFRF